MGVIARQFSAELSDRKICLDGTCNSKYVIALQPTTVSIAFEVGSDPTAGWCSGITACVALDRTCCQEVKQPTRAAYQHTDSSKQCQLVKSSDRGDGFAAHRHDVHVTFTGRTAPPGDLSKQVTDLQC